MAVLQHGSLLYDMLAEFDSLMIYTSVLILYVLLPLIGFVTYCN